MKSALFGVERRDANMAQEIEPGCTLYCRRLLIRPKCKNSSDDTRGIKFLLNDKESTIYVSNQIQEVSWAPCVRFLGFNIRDFKIQYGEALVRLMQRKETGPTTPSPAKTQID